MGIRKHVYAPLMKLDTSRDERAASAMANYFGKKGELATKKNKNKKL